MPRSRAAARPGAIAYPPTPRTRSGRKRSSTRSAAAIAVGSSHGSARFFQGASRSRPRTLIVSRTNPAAGTSRSSSPPARPSIKREASGCSTRNACATASAGRTCPPVPPPEISSRITSPPSIPLLDALGGDVEQHAGRRHGYGERGPSIADEGQGHPGDGNRVRHRPHVEQRLERDPGGDPGRQGHPEAVRRPHRGPVAAQGQEHESFKGGCGSDQSGLLAEDGEDEVGVRLWKPEVLLHRVAETDACHSPRAERPDRL